MRKKFLGALMLGLVALGTTSTITSCKDYDDDISSLKADVESNKASIEKAKADLESEISSLKSDLAGAQADIIALQSDMDNAQGDIAANTDKLITAQADIASLEKRIANAEELLKDLNTLLSGKVDKSEFTETTQKMMDEIKANSAAIAANTDLIKANDAAIKANTAAIATKVSQDDFSAACTAIYARLETLEKNLGDALKSIQVNADGIKENAASIAKNAKAIDEANGTIKILQDGLNNEITAREAADKNLQDQIDVLNTWLTKVDKLVSDNKVAIDKNAVDIAANSDAITANTKAINANGVNIDLLKAQIATIVEQIEQAQKDIAGNSSAIDALTGIVSNNSSAILENAADIATIQENMNTLCDVISALQDQVNVLEIFVKGALRGLVFQPDFYYKGIEAFDVATFNYDAISVNAVSADADNSTDAPTALLDAQKKVVSISMAPGVSATYHMNPSTADIKTDASAYSFLTLDREYRATSSAVLNVYKAEKIGGGCVKVSANVTDASKIITDVNLATTAANDVANNVVGSDLYAKGNVTVAALQYNSGDTVITSDYAAITKSYYSHFELNEAKIAAWNSGLHQHLYKSAADAIAADPQETILWNGTLDLRTLVNTHRFVGQGTYDPEADSEWDKDATAGTVENYGFKYSFQLVGYKAGVNETSETAHLALNSDGYTVRAQMTKDGKQQAYGANQNKAEVGRMPLVRVVLTDTISKKVAAVGYIKLEIVEEEAPKTCLEVKYGPWDNDYTVKCEGDAFTKTLSWYEIEESLIDTLNISKTQFEADYQLDGAANVFNKYTAATTDATITSNLGKVEQTYVDVKGTQTEVISWTVTNAEAYAYFNTADAKTKVKPTSVTVYVRYVDKATGKKFVYVALTWTPKSINITPAAEIVDADKIKEYWYSKNNATHDGYADIHGNVEVIGQTGADDEFVFDVNNTFVGNKVQLKNLPDVYADLQKASVISFTFVTPQVTAVKGNDGNSYTLGVSTDGTKFMAIKGSKFNESKASVLAVIVPSTGVITYQNNAVSKALLNYAGHKSLGDAETLTGRVSISAATCAPAGTIAFTNNDNAFNVKFLRPINVSDMEASFVDAATGGSYADIVATFTDWRDYDFLNEADVKAGYDYFKYYGVTSIVPDMTAITTNMNGGTLGTTKLSDVTSKVKFTFIAPTGQYSQITAKKYGQLKYENNGTTVDDFKVQIPVTITYTWGTINTKLVATVGKTIANGAKRK